MKIGKKTRSKNWCGNENHKAKKRADLELYRQQLDEQGGRTYRVDDCFKRATGSIKSTPGIQLNTWDALIELIELLKVQRVLPEEAARRINEVVDKFMAEG